MNQNGAFFGGIFHNSKNRKKSRIQPKSKIFSKKYSTKHAYLFTTKKILGVRCTLRSDVIETDTDETASSQSSQMSVTENEISIWTDEMEQQQEKRQTLNAAISSLTSGRTSPILSTLNTSWDDISSTQQRYYQRKAKETILAALSVISPGQEEDLWDALRKDSSLSTSGQKMTSRKSFDPCSAIIDSLVKAYYQANSWQTKRQILSIFANDFSRSELMILIPSLSKWRIDQARQHASR